VSRYGDPDYEEDFPNQGAFWQTNARRALKGKRGKKALAELREALLHLPEKKLIARALCTVNPEKRRPAPYSTAPIGVANWRIQDFDSLVSEVGEGVCAIGAFLWWKQVKAGKTPEEAFDALPTHADTDVDISETAWEGHKAGLVYSLAWELAYRNDETYEDITAEERYTRFLEWIEKELAS
jgi:hypothetical protein